MNSKAIEKAIRDCYAHLIGQKNLINSRVNAWVAWAEKAPGALAPCAFFAGVAGLGKTAMMKADVNAANKAMEIRGHAGKAELILDPMYLRAPKPEDEGGRMVARMVDPSDVDFYYLDETQHVFEKTTMTIPSRQLLMFIKGVTEKGQGYMRSGWYGETKVTKEADNVCWVMGSNFLSRISDKDALLSRLEKAQLEFYTPAELQAIAHLMAKGAGLTANEDSLGVMARGARGTARPLETMVQALIAIAHKAEKHSVNRDDILLAMQMKEMFPLGLNKLEVFLLSRKAASYSVIKKAYNPDAADKSLSDAYSFLIENNFIEGKASGYQNTTHGDKYLATLTHKGFIIPTTAKETK